jgi:hypothetical protein
MLKNLPNGAIAWEGNSLLNDSPIVLILTGLNFPSHNSKTGDLIQSWVLQQDYLPSQAWKEGKDTGVCGNCPLKRICYVNLIPVNNLWRKYKAGGYPLLDNKILSRIKRRHRQLRVTSYGEATAIPFDAWIPLLEAAAGNTGYTHQWRDCDRRWQRYLMASVEDPKDVAIANSLGWRTFRPITSVNSLLPREIICTNSQDRDVTCEDCRLCSGTNRQGANIADLIHGIDWKIRNFQALAAKFEN